MKVLVEWNTNWADEMDIQGFCLLEVETIEDLKEQIRNHPYNKSKMEICIGTNEEIYYSDVSEFMQDLSFEHLSENEYEVVNKLFGKEWGHTSFIQYIIKYY